eukprot:GHVS01007438.1.p1 GENE.GHVS01007438.1~~GHVS01007438.1.p1  ORF type:complete len:272 (-),score=70.10 GHVS01007438.1:148-963(-)
MREGREGVGTSPSLERKVNDNSLAAEEGREGVDVLPINRCADTADDAPVKHMNTQQNQAKQKQQEQQLDPPLICSHNTSSAAAFIAVPTATNFLPPSSLLSPSTYSSSLSRPLLLGPCVVVMPQNALLPFGPSPTSSSARSFSPSSSSSTPPYSSSFSSPSSASFSSLSLHVQLLLLTSCCCLLFVFRGLFNIFVISREIRRYYPFSPHTLSRLQWDCLLYVATEAVPSAMMLVAFWQRPRRAVEEGESDWWRRGGMESWELEEGMRGLGG